jgi:hypothetical protein
MSEEIRVEKRPQIELKITCPLCLNLRYLFIPKEDFEGFVHGKLVQYAFPYLDEDTRESIISGVCPRCWGKHSFEISMKGKELAGENRIPRGKTPYHCELQTV